MRIEGFFNGPPSRQGSVLLSGKTYTFRVLSVNGRHAVLGLAGGGQLRAVLDEVVQVGHVYRARASIKGTQTLLELLPRSAVRTAGSTAAELGLPDTPAASATIRAFMTVGLPLERAALRRVLRRVEKDEGRSSPAERARIGALLEERGLTDDVSWFALMDVLGFSTPERDEDAPSEYEHDASVERQLKESLRFSRDGDHPLQLFNHITASAAHWIIIPFRIRHQGVLTGSVRLRVQTSRSAGFATRLAYDAAVVDVSSEPRSSFRLENRDGALRITQVTGEILGTKEQARLSTALQRVGAFLDLNPAPSDDGEFDGFSTLVEPDILRGTDTRV